MYKYLSIYDLITFEKHGSDFLSLGEESVHLTASTWTYLIITCYYIRQNVLLQSLMWAFLLWIRLNVLISSYFLCFFNFLSFIWCYSLISNSYVFFSFLNYLEFPKTILDTKGHSGQGLEAWFLEADVWSTARAAWGHCTSVKPTNACLLPTVQPEHTCHLKWESDHCSRWLTLRLIFTNLPWEGTRLPGYF